MKYKGYTARIDWDAEEDTFVGRVLGIKDMLVFAGDDKISLHQEMVGVIDDYIALCAEKGKNPNKPHSGKVLLRVPSEVHAMIKIAAANAKMSLNSWLVNTINHGLAEDGVIKTS